MDELTSTVNTTRTVVLISLILLIIFIIVSIGFAFYPVSQSSSLVDKVVTDSKQALDLLKLTAAQSETIFLQLDAAAVQASQAEDNIEAFIATTCQDPTSPIFGTQFCKQFHPV